jgi:lipopolysaccharide heptosyltransferase III
MKPILTLKSKPNNILIISMRYLGDTLLTTPLIRTIKIAYPDSNIDVLVYQNTASMLTGNPDIREIITTPTKPGWQDLKALVKKLFRRYDLSIVTQTGDRRILYGMLAAPLRIGFVPKRDEKGAWKRYLIQGWVEHSPRQKHTVLEFLDLASILNIPPSYDLVPPKPSSLTPPINFETNQPYAVIHLYPQWAFKQWHRKGWLAVGQHLNEIGLKIILSGGPDQQEAAYIDQIQKDLPADTLNLAGKISLPELGHVISKAKLFIGPDTGITHLASAMGIPVIAIFGPTSPAKWGPWPYLYRSNNDPFHKKGSQHVNNVYLLQGNSDNGCVPCQEEGCERHRNSHSQCLDNLSAKEVINAINALI